MVTDSGGRCDILLNILPLRGRAPYALCQLLLNTPWLQLQLEHGAFGTQLCPEADGLYENTTVHRMCPGPFNLHAYDRT
jgi:hypothetical protein